MRHLIQNACGIKDMRCIGIKYILEQTAFNDLYNKNYLESIKEDNTIDKSRQQDDNFYNLPRTYQGLIHKTPYIDLGDVVDKKIKECCSSYDPFQLQGNGLVDYFYSLSTASGNLAPFNTVYNNKLQGYKDDNQEKPGVLVVTPNLSDFNITPAITIPDYISIASNIATAVGSSVIAKAPKVKGLKASIAAQMSPCTGFKIDAWFKDGTKRSPKNYAQKKTQPMTVGLSVTAGVIVMGDNKIDVPKKTLNDVLFFNDKDQSVGIMIYIKLEMNRNTGLYEYSDHVIFEADTKPDPKKWVQLVYIGGVTVGRDDSAWVLSITQVQCSPIYLHDATIEHALPSKNDDWGTAVFAYDYDSNKQYWMAVKDC